MAQRFRPDAAVVQRERLHRAVVIEKAESKNQSAVAVDNHKAPVANAGDELEETGLELRFASHTENRIAVWTRGIERGIVRGLRAAFDAVAIRSEWIDAFAVALFEAGEIHIRNFDQLGGSFALGRGD